MAAQPGRETLIKVGDGQPTEAFITIGGARSKTLSINNTEVDITNSDSANQRELLAGAGVTSVSMSVSGVFVDDTAFSTLEGYARSAAIETYQFIFDDWGTYEGEFLCTNFEEGAEHDGEATFSADFASSGTVGFTAA